MGHNTARLTVSQHALDFMHERLTAWRTDVKRPCFVLGVDHGDHSCGTMKITWNIGDADVVEEHCNPIDTRDGYPMAFAPYWFDRLWHAPSKTFVIIKTSRLTGECLQGTFIDYETLDRNIGAQLVFHVPGAHKCGCGTAFTIKEKS